MDQEFFSRVWEKILTFLNSTVHTPFKNDFELKAWVWILLIGIILFSIISIMSATRKQHP